MSRRGTLDRVVDLAVAVPTCTFIAVRRAVPLAARFGALGSAKVLGQVTDAVHDRNADQADIDVAVTHDPSETDGDTSVGAETATVDVDELAIDGYDDLAARQIVDRLGDLDASDLLRIEVYEREHRGRSTVLGKIAMLTE